MPIHLYFFIILFELIFVIAFTVIMASLLYSSFRGAPYVPTKKAQIENILKLANLKNGQQFVELGCGDGRVVRTAVQKYRVQGTGIDINPVLIFLARIKSRANKDTAITWKVENIFDTELKQFDVIYLFLMPEMLDKLASKIQKEAKKGTLIISHGFKITQWTRYLTQKVDAEPFPTYYYRIK